MQVNELRARYRALCADANASEDDRLAACLAWTEAAAAERAAAEKVARERAANIPLVREEYDAARKARSARLEGAR